MFDLSGRVALITGAGQGMGYGIAEAMLGQGATLVINDLHAERAQRAVDALAAGAAGSAAATAGDRLLAVGGDVTEDGFAQRAVAATLARFGQLDILVNNAGVPEGMALVPFCDMPAHSWQAYIDLNLMAVMHMSRAALEPMRERGWGRMITVVSEAWRSGLGIGVAPYAAGKAGAIGFSRQLAGEMGRFGITVNCVSLGQMENVEDPDNKIARHNPIPRLGKARDAAAAAVFLASDEAEWITGQCLPVNGGIVAA